MLEFKINNYTSFIETCEKQAIFAFKFFNHLNHFGKYKLSKFI